MLITSANQHPQTVTYLRSAFLTKYFLVDRELGFAFGYGLLFCENIFVTVIPEFRNGFACPVA